VWLRPLAVFDVRTLPREDPLQHSYRGARRGRKIPQEAAPLLGISCQDPAWSQEAGNSKGYERGNFHSGRDLRATSAIAPAAARAPVALEPNRSGVVTSKP